MQIVYDYKAPKKATNLSVNSDLLKKARQLEINLSSIFEKALINVVTIRQTEKWLEENQSSISAYNRYVEKSGVFSHGMRSF